MIENWTDTKRFNVETSYRCTLQCPACFRQNEDFKTLKPKLSDITLDDYTKVAKYANSVNFCGTVSDPIFHFDFIKLLEISYQYNTDVDVRTAASHKSREWYLEAFKSNKKAKWIFGIDGLPEDSNKYRINQDGEKLFSLMVEAKKLGLDVVWQYLIFSYNEHTLIQAKELADKYDIKINFEKTSRYGNQNLKPSNSLTHTKYPKGSENIFYPKCIHKKDLGTHAMGYIVPCCNLQNIDVEKDFPMLCNEDTKLSKVQSIEEIFDTKGWSDYLLTLKNNTSNVVSHCRTICRGTVRKSKQKLEL